MNFAGRLYASVLIILLLALNLVIGAVYLRALSANLNAERMRAETEQYAAALGLSKAASERELSVLYQGFSDAYASTGAQIRLLRGGEAGRTITLIDGEGGREYLAVSQLPEPYAYLSLEYRRTLHHIETAQRALLRDMTFIAAAVFCLASAILMAYLRSLTSPLRHLRRAIHAMKSGARLPIPRKKRHNELTELIDEFHAMATTIDERTAQLQEEIGRRQRFVDDFSHEMRTPVTSLRGYAQMLLEAKLDETARNRALNYIASESMRMQALSEKLLTLAGLRGGALKKRPIPLPALAAHIREIVLPGFVREEIKLSIETEGDKLTGDEVLIVSLAVNLLENARRASAPGGCVKLRLSGTLLSVADEGRGMSEEELTRARDPFYRADASRSRAHGGAGLGLAICAAIADAHGAEMRITSARGKGTRAEVLFANMMQSGADFVPAPVVSSKRGKSPAKEEKSLKKIIILGAIVACACFSLIFLTPRLLSLAEQATLPTEVPVGAGEALIPLPTNRMELRDYAETIYTRKWSISENMLWQSIDEEFEDRKDNALSLGIPPMGTEPTDGPYYETKDGRVKVTLPNRDMTRDEMLRMWVYQQQRTDYASKYLYDDGPSRSMTANEHTRYAALEEAYANGRRPVNPIPTAEGEDGFWYEESENDIHYSNTYEMTDEQLLQIIDHYKRTARAFDAIYVDPIRSTHTDDEWIDIARDLLAAHEYYTQDAENAGAEWIVDTRGPFDQSDTMSMSVTLKCHPENTNYDYYVVFDPMSDNRVHQIRKPRPQDRSVGDSYRSDKMSLEDYKIAMDDPKWTQTAETYLKRYVYTNGEDFSMKVVGIHNREYDSDDVAWEVPHGKYLPSAYVQVAAKITDGSGPILLIDPDTLDVIGYDWTDDVAPLAKFTY